MLAEKTKRKVYFILTGVMAAIIIGLLIWAAVRSPGKEAPAPTAVPAPTPRVVVQEKEVEKLVEVEKEITAEIIRDGVRDMGVLVTEEYYFTEAITYSSMKKLFDKEIPFTESSYVATYDGVITAGIDFTAAQIRKDDQTGRITVTLPTAEILNVDVDPESFVLYDERIKPWNPISAGDYNDSLIKLEEKAREKALSRGLLDRADENARTLVRNMIAGLVDTSRYTIEFAN